LSGKKKNLEVSVLVIQGLRTTNKPKKFGRERKKRKSKGGRDAAGGKTKKMEKVKKLFQTKATYGSASGLGRETKGSHRGKLTTKTERRKNQTGGYSQFPRNQV